MLAVCLGLLLLAGPARAALDYARPAGPVADYAKIIPAQAQKTITALSTELLQKTGASLVVATVPSLDGESIEQAAVQLYQKWGIGKKGEDKGVLLLVAPKERKLRIEVGYGLEGVITDATSGEIIRRAIVPYFKKGDMATGILTGSAVLAQMIAKDAGVKLSGLPEGTGRSGGTGFGLGGLIVAILIFVFLMRGMRRRGGPGGRGGGSGVLPAMLLGSMLGSSMGGPSRGGGGGFDSFGGGFGGFGGGMSGGGGASGGW